MRPLEGVRVVDLTTLLPGPLATRLLADAGAEVVKIERPGGEAMRRVPPMAEGVSVLWSWLNRGKRIVELDLKSAAGRAAALALVADAQVLVEQFRPGVLARLGLDPATLRRRCADLVVCSITGYGQENGEAGHDLDYQARAGLLGRIPGGAMPAALTADIAGGSWPAVINILLALRRAERGGGGAHLDIAMTANVAPFLLFALAEHRAHGTAPAPGSLVTEGGAARYGLYACADGRLLAVAAFEEVFWRRFTRAIDLPTNADRSAVAGRLAERPAAAWAALLEPLDCCVTPVVDLEAALAAGWIAVDAAGPAMPLAPALRE